MSAVNIIAVPFHDWKKGQSEGFRTRDGHLLQEFRKHPLINKLLIIDRPISIIEMIVLRRPWRINGGNQIYQDNHKCLTQLDERTFVLDILSLEIIKPLIQRREWLPSAYGNENTSKAIDEAKSHLNFNDYFLLLFSPLPMPLYWNLKQPDLVVDAVDNLLKIPQFFSMRDEIRGFYNQIRDNADLIFTNSQENQEFLSNDNQQAIYIPNGVDFHRFKPKSNEIPEDIRSLTKPVIGYAGKMQDLFDVDLLVDVANAFPNVSFVCIGQILNRKWMNNLWQSPNVHYLGDKHYDILPDYLAKFDICMIPYNLGRHHNNDPIKFYEYLSVGKPVITTNIGGVSKFEEFPHVKIVANSDEFIQAINHFLEMINNGNNLPKINLPADVLWSTKADKMIKAIIQAASIPSGK